MQLDGLQFILSDKADKTARDFIHQQIRAFNDAVSEHHRAVRPAGPSPLDVFIHDQDGQIVGGLVADTYWGWLDIEDLWIDRVYTRRGYGRKLMGLAETEAPTEAIPDDEEEEEETSQEFYTVSGDIAGEDISSTTKR